MPRSEKYKPQLTNTLNAWGTTQFDSVFKKEVLQLGVEQLPLQLALTATSHALDGSLSVMIINTLEQTGFIRVKAGIFYSGIIAGCNCADDPTPVSEYNEYCVLQFDINKYNAETTVTLLEE